MNVDLNSQGISRHSSIVLSEDEDSSMICLTLFTSPDWTAEDIAEYFYSSCSCEHDCCGHWFSSVYEVMAVRAPSQVQVNDLVPGSTIIEIGDLRMWLVFVSSGRNV